MRVLVISQFFAPDITAAAFRVTDVVGLLANAGHEVRVITSLPHKAQVEDGRSGEGDSERVRIYRCKLNELGDGGTRRYLSHYMSFVRRSILRGIGVWLTGWRPDVIWATSPPLFVGLSARFLSVLYRRPLVFEIRDIWPDTAVAAGQLSPDGRAYKLGRKLERYVYRKAQHITCVSKPMQAYLQGQTETPTTVIYNGVPADQARFEDGASRRKRASDGERTLLYAGNIGHLQELDLLIRGFVELRKTGQTENWRLRVVGAGTQVKNLIELAGELDADDYVSIDLPLSRENVLRAMMEADMLYLNLKRHPVLARTIPSKVFDYLLAARPIVAGLAGEGRGILESTGANVCFEPGDVDALKRAVAQAIERLEELDRHSLKNRELVLAKYTREKGVTALMSVFKKVVAPNEDWPGSVEANAKTQAERVES